MDAKGVNGRRGLDRHFIGLGVLLLLLLALFWSSYASIVAIWLRSPTFAHGFLVIPAVLFLIWRQRVPLRRIEPRVDARALLALAALVLAWLVARAGAVLLIEQLSAALLIPSLVWLMLGWPLLRALAFPLGFLVLFGVPMGDGLIEPLMAFTALVVVSLLRLSDIPVLWEGAFISVPSGDWAVVEACSGIRYLIASLFLGALYAALAFRRLGHRLLFIALAALLPILANGVRAYLIVLIGHLSDRRLAVGVDHLIYGWVFFGFLMFLLFAIGQRWSARLARTGSAEAADTSSRPASALEPRQPPETARPLLLGLLAALAILGSGPLLAAWMERPCPAPADVALVLPPPGVHWRALSAPASDWAPSYREPLARVHETYAPTTADEAEKASTVGLYLALYGGGRGELVNALNVLVEARDRRWRLIARDARRVRIGGRSERVIEAQLDSPARGQRLLVWQWYWIEGDRLSRDVMAKARETLWRLGGRPARAVGVVLYTPLELNETPARARLERFSRELLPSIETALEAWRPE